MLRTTHNDLGKMVPGVVFLAISPGGPSASVCRLYAEDEQFAENFAELGDDLTLRGKLEDCVRVFAGAG